MDTNREVRLATNDWYSHVMKLLFHFNFITFDLFYIQTLSEHSFSRQKVCFLNICLTFELKARSQDSWARSFRTLLVFNSVYVSLYFVKLSLLKAAGLDLTPLFAVKPVIYRQLPLNHWAPEGNLTWSCCSYTENLKWLNNFTALPLNPERRVNTEGNYTQIFTCLTSLSGAHTSLWNTSTFTGSTKSHTFMNISPMNMSDCFHRDLWCRLASTSAIQGSPPPHPHFTVMLVPASRPQISRRTSSGADKDLTRGSCVRLQDWNVFNQAATVNQHINLGDDAEKITANQKPWFTREVCASEST